MEGGKEEDGRKMGEGREGKREREKDGGEERENNFSERVEIKRKILL